MVELQCHHCGAETVVFTNDKGWHYWPHWWPNARIPCRESHKPVAATFENLARLAMRARMMEAPHA